MSRPKKTTSEPEKAPTKKKPENKAVVYCGPTFKGIVRQFTVFNNGLPENVKAIIDRYPVIASLIVPVDDFAAFKLTLGQPDTAASLIYTRSIQLIKGGK